jgi:hypothetical protein
MKITIHVGGNLPVKEGIETERVESARKRKRSIDRDPTRGYMV